MANSYTENIQLTETVIAAKQMVEKALKHAGFRKTKWVEEQQAFYSESAVTIWSWGEDILVRFQENDNGTMVQFTSSCKLSTQIVDWGKNRKNAKKFTHFLHGS